MTKFLSLLLLCVFSLTAQAQTTFGVHVASAHLPNRDDQNNQNVGLYIRHSGVQAGFYRNTINRTTAYLGYVHSFGPVDLMGAMASGYKKKCSRYTTDVVGQRSPVYERTATSATVSEECTGFASDTLVPLVTLSYKAPEVLGLTPRISFIPSIGKHSNVLHLSFERSL